MTLESLEKREVLSAAPTAMTQYTLELVNLARTNPTAAANWISSHITANDQATLDYYHINLDQELNAIRSAAPQPALAWNDTLAQTALNQSNDQAANNFQGHDSSNGTTFSQRLTNAGYNATSSGEDAFAYANSVDHAIKAFLVDWGVADKGHRRNILQPGVAATDAYSEVGIGITATGTPTNTPNKVGPYVVTMDFGARASQSPQLLGVAYNDADHSGLYAPGEGAAGIVIEAKNLATGQVSSTTTSPAGGYQMPLTPGTYQVVDKDNGAALSTRTVSIGSTNVKLDFSDIPTTPPSAPTPVQAQPIAQAKPVVVTQPVTPTVLKAAVVTPTVTAPVTTPIQPVLTVSQLESFVNSWVAFRGGVRLS
jgi:uncharacterized protein YkwD